ncbi:MAG: hypothetical protein IAG10_29540 [Planctomycetaceae bacterium]|nr:hypothetical protein [Planctomycetaceae bacterium]
MTDTARIGLTLSPLDTLFFRDGRPFEATSRATTGLPQPRTFAGAIRTELLARYSQVNFAELIHLLTHNSSKSRSEHFRERGVPACHEHLEFRGPWPAVKQNSGELIPLLPVPATLARKRGDRGALGTWYQAKPVTVNAQSLLWRKQDEPDADHPEGFLTLQGIKQFLRGELRDPDESLDNEWFSVADVYEFDHRTGIGIDADSLTVSGSMLFGTRMLALNPKINRESVSEDQYEGAQIVLYGEIVLPNADDVSQLPTLEWTMPFGGEGRCVQLAKSLPVDWGCSTEKSEKNQRLWLLASPGIFSADSADRGQACPACFSDKVLKAAASSGAVAVSGWDSVRRGPKPTRFAVPAGAVYFTEGPVDIRHQSLCSDPELVAEGWGHVLEGVWS